MEGRQPFGHVRRAGRRWKWRVFDKAMGQTTDASRQHHVLLQAERAGRRGWAKRHDGPLQRVEQDERPFDGAS